MHRWLGECRHDTHRAKAYVRTQHEKIHCGKGEIHQTLTIGPHPFTVQQKRDTKIDNKNTKRAPANKAEQENPAAQDASSSSSHM